MATHSSVLAWKIPWAEESGGLQFMGLHRVRHDQATKHVHTRSTRTFSASEPHTALSVQYSSVQSLSRV